MKRFIRVYGSGSGSVRHPGVLSFAAKLTKIEDGLHLETKRGRGHSRILNGNHAKIVKALTCYLCPKMPTWLLGSLRSSKSGFETMVSD